MDTGTYSQGMESPTYVTDIGIRYNPIYIDDCFWYPGQPVPTSDKFTHSTSSPEHVRLADC
jgi:hypothetical protein